MKSLKTEIINCFRGKNVVCINYLRNVNDQKREEHVKKGYDGCVYCGRYHHAQV